MIIAISSIKGGCSKTTLSCNIAARLAQLNHSVLLIDLDIQHSSFDWVNRRNRNYPEYPYITCSMAIDKKAMVEYAYIIIDSPINKNVVNIADYIIIPFRPSLLDVSTIPMILKIVGTRTAIAVLTQCPTNSITDTNGAIELLSSYEKIFLIDTLIHYRKSYIDSMCGLGVTEGKETKAKQEIINLTNEVLKWQR